MSLLNSPVMVSLEVSLLQEIIRIIGAAVHRNFSHDEINALKQHLVNKGQEAVQQSQSIEKEVKDAT